MFFLLLCVILGVALAAKAPTPRHSDANSGQPAPEGYYHLHPLDALPLCTFLRTDTVIEEKSKSSSKKKSKSSSSNGRDRVFFFDLEDTLYMAHDMKMAKVKKFYTFCEKTLKMEDEREIIKLILDKPDALLATMKTHGVTIDDPYEFISPNKDITDLITSMNARLWIMTNSSLYRIISHFIFLNTLPRNHAKKVLKQMGLYNYFEGIVFKFPTKGVPGSYLGKSQRTFYDIAMLAADVKYPDDCYFIDDSIYNVFMAMNCGWNAVLYHNKKFHRELPPIYYEKEAEINRIASMSQLRYIFPELFTKVVEENGEVRIPMPFSHNP